jgi:glycosyltransferase involved in cell wall biosynthesis
MRALYSKPITTPAMEAIPGFELVAEEAALSAEFGRKWTHGSELLVRLYLAFTLLRRRRHFDVIVTGRYGEYFALLQALYPFGRKPHILLDIEWVAQSNNGWKPRLSRWMRKQAILGATKIQVFCRAEADNYARFFGTDKQNFVWIPYCAAPLKLATQLPQTASTPAYLFCGGTHHRDYATLFSAVQNLPIEVRVAAPTRSFNGMVVPKNVTILGEVSPEEYWKQLAQSLIVVLSLEPDLLRFPGVITYVRAMQLGKCVVINESIGGADYVTHGETGVLVPPSDAAALRTEIQELLENPSLRVQLGANAYRAAAARFSPGVYREALQAILKSVLDKQQ